MLDYCNSLWHKVYFILSDINIASKLSLVTVCVVFSHTFTFNTFAVLEPRKVSGRQHTVVSFSFLKSILTNYFFYLKNLSLFIFKLILEEEGLLSLCDQSAFYHHGLSCSITVFLSVCFFFCQSTMLIPFFVLFVNVIFVISGYRELQWTFKFMPPIQSVHELLYSY